MKLLRWVTPAVLGIEAVLLITDRLDLGEAAIALLAVEIALAALIVTVAVLRFRRARRAGLSTSGSLSDAMRAVLPRPIATLVAREAALVGAVARWVTRRPRDVPPSAQAIGYGRDQVALVITFVALTVVEVVIVEWIVPWPPLRLLLVILGGYGLLVIGGFVAINRTRPHVLHDNELRLRCGSFADLTLDVAEIVSVTATQRNCGYRPQISDELLSMGVGNQTQLEIRLAAPRTVSVDRVSGVVGRIHVAADDPSAAAHILRQAITAPGKA